MVRGTRDRQEASCRPVTQRCNSRLRRALVAPCTTTIRGLPSEVILDPSEDPIPRPSAINLDSVESVAVAVLVERIGQLSDAENEGCVPSA